MPDNDDSAYKDDTRQRRKSAAQAEIDALVTRTVVEAGIASLTAPKTITEKPDEQ